jgi:integrase/recombinase XerD
MAFTPRDLVPVKSSENTFIPEQFSDPGDVRRSLTISAVAPAFLDWTRYEMRRAPATIQRYREALGWIIRDVGDVPIASLHIGHILELRRRMDARGCQEARMASILNSLRSLLKFSGTILRLPVLDPRSVRIPRIPRRDVVYLTKEEIARFLMAIVPEDEAWEKAPISRLRFRALVEVLLGTGARISEILKLDRRDVSFEHREARVIGKGNKERTLFFSERSLEWLKRYLDERTDNETALFVDHRNPPRRITYAAVKTAFSRTLDRSGLRKTVTAHILRHTMATTLLFNGCPIGHIKSLLGHERLDTTCRYYLGLDIRAAKEAHGQFLTYE